MTNNLERNTTAQDGLDAFLDILPPHIRSQISPPNKVDDLIEVVMDLGRSPEIRFTGNDIMLDDMVITKDDIEHITARVGKFGDDNRAGLEYTLHRISALRNRNGSIIGITCRVGRAVFGTIKLIDDLVAEGKSILLLGAPGVGKTTMLREVARALADDKHKRVIIVDTSNEIAGDGDIAHPAIGRARRMQVPRTDLQHRIMIEAVENHMPEVIVIDEISTEHEATAARTIAERGVQLVGTAHGNHLNNVVSNPSLADLVGGVNTVILGDEEAQRRHTQKTVSERKHSPTFDAVVEIRRHNEVVIHPDVGKAVDALLLHGKVAKTVHRKLTPEGTVESKVNEDTNISSIPRDTTVRAYTPRRHGTRAYHRNSAPRPQLNGNSETNNRGIKIHAFGISRAKIMDSVAHSGVPVILTDTPTEADIFLTTKSHQKRCQDKMKEANRHGVAIHILRRASEERLASFMHRMAYKRDNSGVQEWEINLAKDEVKNAIENINAGEPEVELSPQTPYIRRIQHKLAESYGFSSTSYGLDEERHVVLRLP